ncbi:helix-turn-helix domain-containing protein [Galbitalea sp. SE-J8]|uniref:helix-turn-helix domain-containing protein n=1 Tax=Galbitalea sp. SE-J8 TaxID=3054952 RepID=UPI00259D1CEB|nr:helix-turn-helix domain-containing protein [Galbitalea sp. SE-J8]MDM4763644.1 helix-turn-helix domain-containing protein [Galbitalea sp. SE-J8]
MDTIDTSRVSLEQLAQLETAAASISPELRDVVHAIYGHVLDGAAIAAIDLDETYTPSKAAERLGMSRTHLYKLLDRGEILSEPVGRDRRIRARDLLAFEQRRQRDRRELAERFARHQQIKNAAIDELAELL